MSASLVGSEMCIRDSRRSTCGGVCMRGQHAIKHWSTTRKTIALSSGEAEPVSYTHLTLPTICSV
eukprot:5064557-Alexandrium_andersonii.AAC.1